MYRVSLLPSEYKNHQVSSRKKDLLVLITGATAMAMMIVFVALSMIASMYDKNLISIEKENKRIEKSINEYKYIDILQSEVQAMQLQILQIAGSSLDWSKVVSEIGNSVPPKIGLSSIAVTYQGENGILAINGHASSHKEVADWMKEIDRIEGLSDVKCVKSVMSPEKDNEVDFELNIPLPNNITATGGV